MKTLTKIALGAGLAASLLGGAAWAAGPRGGECPWFDGKPFQGKAVERVFDRLDADHDGTITLAEAMAAVDARFDKIDANHDGVVDKSEVESWIGRRAPAGAVDRFMAMHDLDGDGKVTKAEFEKPAKKVFAVFDRNDDGKITKAEAELAMPLLMGFGPHHGRGMHDGSGMGHGMGPGMGHGMGPGMMEPDDEPATPPPPAK